MSRTFAASIPAKAASHSYAGTSGDYSVPGIDPGSGVAMRMSPRPRSCMQEKDSFPDFVYKNCHYRQVLEHCFFSHLRQEYLKYRREKDNRETQKATSFKRL
jgi:hypothetical protein